MSHNTPTAAEFLTFLAAQSAAGSALVYWRDYLPAHWFPLAAVVIGVAVIVTVAWLLVWARLFPNPDHQCECCGDEPRVPTVYGDDR